MNRVWWIYLKLRFDVIERLEEDGPYSTFEA